MDEKVWLQFDEQVQQTAQKLPYPPTPAIAGTVGRRLRQRQDHQRSQRAYRLAVGLAAVVLLLSGLMVIPQVRAVVSDVLRIGAMQIFVQEALPTPQETAVASRTVVDTPALSLSDLGKPVLLAEAQRQISVPLHLPVFPPELGVPDRVFLQELWDQIAAVTMLWPASKTHPQIALTQIAAPNFGRKLVLSEQVVETAVDGETAFWIVGPHPMSLIDAETDPDIIVESNVLLWSSGNVTYRLEGAIPLEYALRIANSLQGIE